MKTIRTAIYLMFIVAAGNSTLLQSMERTSELLPPELVSVRQQIKLRRDPRDPFAHSHVLVYDSDTERMHVLGRLSTITPERLNAITQTDYVYISVYATEKINGNNDYTHIGALFVGTNDQNLAQKYTARQHAAQIHSASKPRQMDRQEILRQEALANLDRKQAELTLEILMARTLKGTVSTADKDTQTKQQRSTFCAIL